MVRKFALFIVLLSVIGSCKKKQEDKFIYEFIFFRDNNIKMQPDTIPVSFKNAIENGQYILNDENGRPISEGKFSAGFREGKWLYYPSDTATIAIDWSKYVDDNFKIEINYPKTWKVLKDPKRPFQARLPLDGDEDEKGKYFIILSHNKDSIDLDLYGYQRYYKSQMLVTENIKEYAHFLFETASGRKFYFMRYIIQRGEEELSIFTFIGERNSQIYDVTYSSLNERNEEKHIIFFDMIRSFRLYGNWFFSPYDPIKHYERFEYQDRPKTTT